MDITKHFKEKVVEVVNKESIENENLRRAYIIGIMNDNLSPSKIVEMFSMSSYRGAVMPLVKRGKTPNWDRFAPVKMDKMELMHFWVQAAHTEYTIAWAEKKINAMAKQNASTTDIEDLIAEIYSKLYYDRIVRWQDLLAYQVGQCLSNFKIAPFDGEGFVSKGLIHQNDIFKYKVNGFGAVIDGSEMNPTNPIIPAHNPIKYLLDKLVTSSRGEVNEIWMGDNWATWFLNNPAWKEMHPTRLMLEHKDKYKPAGTSSEVDTIGATLLYEYDAIKIRHITKKATIFHKNGTKETVPVFNPDSIVSVNTETLGSIVYGPMYLEKDNPLIKMISDNSKLNYYQDFSTGNGVNYAGKGSQFVSGGKCLAAITGIDSIQRILLWNAI